MSGRLFESPASRIDDTALRGANNFHLIRLGAALLVLFAHSFHLLARAAEEPVGRWFIWLDASLLGVSTFFFISGFLIARSWDVRRDLVGFLSARAVRIAPALWVVVLVTVMVLGPLVTTLPVLEYFGATDTRRYLLYNVVLLTYYRLPGVFESNPLPGINGALWTIPLEVVLYVVLGATGWLVATLVASRAASARPHPTKRTLTRTAVAVALVAVAVVLAWKIIRTGPQYYLLAGYFVLGAGAWRFRSRLRLASLVAALLVALTIGVARTWAGPLLAPLTIGYGVLVVALHPRFRIRETWLHRHDYSYGTYLYGFPVQQALIAAGVNEPWLLFACSTPLTLGCAALSWHLVEHPMLQRKNAIGAWLRRRLPVLAVPA